MYWLQESLSVAGLLTRLVFLHFIAMFICGCEDAQLESSFDGDNLGSAFEVPVQSEFFSDAVDQNEIAETYSTSVHSNGDIETSKHQLADAPLHTANLTLSEASIPDDQEPTSESVVPTSEQVDHSSPSERPGVPAFIPKVSRTEFELRFTLTAQEYARRMQNNDDRMYVAIIKARADDLYDFRVEFVRDYRQRKEYQIRVNGIRAIVPIELVNEMHQATIDLDESNDRLMVIKSTIIK